MPSSTFTVNSSASRPSGAPGGQYSPTMDSKQSCRNSTASNAAPDRTGTYRNGDSSMSFSSWGLSAGDANTTIQEDYVMTVASNNKGKREVVIVQHKTTHADPAAPRSSERYRA